MGQYGPKPFIPVVNGQSALELALRKAEKLGWRSVVVASPMHREQLNSIPRFRAELVFQSRPTGMFDAVSLAAAQCDRTAIVLWCDQVGATLATLKAVADSLKRNLAVSPGRKTSYPYLELITTGNCITGVNESREGDAVSPAGVADAGIHGFQNLPDFIAKTNKMSTLPVGSVTGEVSLLKAMENIYGGSDWRLIDASEQDLLSFNTPEELNLLRSKLTRC